VVVGGVSPTRGQWQPASGEPASRRFSAVWRGLSRLCAAEAQGRCDRRGSGLSCIAADALSWPDRVAGACPTAVGSARSERREYRERARAALLCARAAHAAAAARDGPSALSRDGAADRGTENRSVPAPQLAGWHGPSTDRGMQVADPTALAALVTPELPLAQVPGSLCWLTCLMTLFYWNVPLSGLGRWCGVHKTTILRWVLGLALALWPLIAHWIRARVKAQMVYVDEKWLKSRGRWHYWFVVLDVTTERPVLAALLPSRSQWACRWLGRQLCLLKHVPQVIITDGLQAYAYLAQGARHVLCRFHHQQRVTQWLKQHFTTEEEITTRKKVMKNVFQTHDKRTVRRRLARLKEQAPALGITTWITQVEPK